MQDCIFPTPKMFLQWQCFHLILRKFWVQAFEATIWNSAQASITSCSLYASCSPTLTVLSTLVFRWRNTSAAESALWGCYKHIKQMSTARFIFNGYTILSHCVCAVLKTQIPSFMEYDEVSGCLVVVSVRKYDQSVKLNDKPVREYESTCLHLFRLNPRLTEVCSAPQFETCIAKYCLSQ